MEQDTTARRIRELNDELRTTFVGGKVVITAGVQALSYPHLSELLNLVSGFDTFTADNDPHGEHDFGAVELAGEKYFWKIDYYDRSYLYGSPDPADPEVTRRVLTIMRTDEY